MDERFCFFWTEAKEADPYVEANPGYDPAMLPGQRCETFNTLDEAKREATKRLPLDFFGYIEVRRETKEAVPGGYVWNYDDKPVWDTEELTSIERAAGQGMASVLTRVGFDVQ